MRVHRASPALVVLGAIAGACSAGSPAQPTWIGPAADADVAVDAGCVRQLPTCPADASAIPSYAGQVKMILQERCVYCHRAGSTVAREDFSTYDGIHAEFGTAIDQMYGCLMPPSTESPMPSADKRALLTWLVCMAPNN